MSAEAAVPHSGIAQETLGAWGRANALRWEITRHFEVVHDRKTQVGFDLTLITSRPAACDGDPGCTECARVHAGMEALALSLLPPGTPRDVEPFDGSFHLGDHAAPELLLTVEILPDPAEPDAADRAIKRTLALVESTLRRLGIPRVRSSPSGR